MSHHSRWPLPGPGLGPNPGRNLLTDRRHMSPGCHVSSSSSSGGGSSHDGALKLLSSCGLSPADLALLAELPEDVLTVESLPHVLRQLKGQSGTVQAFPPDVSASSSYPHSCMWRPPGGPAPRDPQKPFSQLLHFRADQVKPSPLLPDQNRRGSLQSPSYAADHRFGPGFRERGLAGPAGPAAGPGPAQGGRKRIWTPGLPNLDYRPAPPPEVYHHERLHQGAPPSSRVQSASATPSSKEALDFHGTPPLAFPYSCALCDITVMSERVSAPGSGVRVGGAFGVCGRGVFLWWSAAQVLPVCVSGLGRTRQHPSSRRRTAPAAAAVRPSRTRTRTRSRSRSRGFSDHVCSSPAGFLTGTVAWSRSAGQ